MRLHPWLAVLVWALSCAPVLAGETVNVTGQATGAFQYPATNTICLRFEVKEGGAQYLVCDDVTPKDIIEKLFALGTKNTPCRIEGMVVKKTGEDVYLRVTQVANAS